MADNPLPSKVKIHAPNTSLQSKVGTTNLDSILTPAIVKNAQAVIVESADQFFVESLNQLKTLEKAYGDLQQTLNNPHAVLATLIETAFSIKTQAGLSGYDLVAALARSLHLYAELLENKKIEDKDLNIIQWHVTTINQLLKAKVKGTGGNVGTAILTEIERLSHK